MKIYTKESLIEIAQTHPRYFTSKRAWNEYAKVQGLPSSQTYIVHFGSWNEAKNESKLALTAKKGAPKYSFEEVHNVLTTHGKNLVNRKQWDEYAHKHKLPTYKTLKKHLDWDEILEYSNKKKKFNLTNEELLKIALKHSETFLSASMSSWNDYARENQLPSSTTYYRAFGSWKQAKIVVIKKAQDLLCKIKDK
ncbi:hypothetical protein ACFFIX_20305 [Metabacillus herbersteinensis]|uniref:Uncharacterized protein n=1 Tax=Metabacillus herbersteinensis TaxID=283816 RepID=A0ABV6GLD3_9BACI